ncbi:SpoIIE family protein phosphatase [Cellulosimicrobium sp. BIT-GX5]|uniref:SpoIIE family protein phosphatase n=1 Tax=Cellulosimicrobium composti TaxID=2672572 RepID=A0A6N7ZEI5_9MICO|nr:SpoIIE family protein phosphatase [Cellulosimicrobium composti]MTG87778.1 SpoIIE family protein phosphatase [Cellulosimicrobium composti]
MTRTVDEPELLAPGEAVDLDNCAREPIHVPGLIQPRGVLLVVREADGVLLQASANVERYLGAAADDLAGRPLADALGEQPARLVLDHAASVADLATRNPVALRLDRWGGSTDEMVDAVLHRPPLPAEGPGAEPVLVVELETAAGARPLTFPNTYLAVRHALRDLERAASLTELYDDAARHVRALTGFDRVMIYRFDADYNGEVVAEARRDDLNSFRGLHYPASDIPPQARALYEKNWIRLIADVDYEPQPVVPTLLPTTGAPLDLTYSTLRSVSPIHLEYLRNMGVRASMSISLLREGKLWGLIACHHYAGPHEPPYEVRTAAEFLGSTLSVRLVAQAEDERGVEVRRAEGVLAHLAADSRDESVPIGTALTRSGWLRRLVRADGAVVVAEGGIIAVGNAPDEDGCRALVAWVLGRDEDLVVTEALGRDAPDVAALAPDVAGAMGIVLPDGQVVVWVRDEVLRHVDWGGDPHNKAIAKREGDTVRLSPRKSFERWREVVRGHSAPWTADQRDVATSLRGHLVEALYLRGRKAVRATEELQRSLLPALLPDVLGWTLQSRYESAGTGLVGGDWYDALVLPSGRIALVVGDVTGHGLQAAATMGQLGTTLRAALVSTGSAVEAVARLAHVARWTLPGEVATLAVALLDPRTGVVEHVSVGHPPLLVVGPDGTTRWAGRASVPPLGLVDRAPTAEEVQVPPGGALVLYSDGLVERRGESIRDGLDRLAAVFADGPGVEVDGIVAAARDPRSADDATLLVVRRDA